MDSITEQIIGELGNVATMLPVVLLTYAIAALVKSKWLTGDNTKLIPAFCVVMGAIIGFVFYLVWPQYTGLDSPLSAITTGAVSGLGSIGFDQVIRKSYQYKNIDKTSTTDDTTDTKE